MDSNPVTVLTQIAERNLSMWQAMSGLGGDNTKKSGSSGKSGDKAAGGDKTGGK